jgi:hypothetical protein
LKSVLDVELLEAVADGIERFAVAGLVRRSERRTRRRTVRADERATLIDVTPEKVRGNAGRCSVA